MSDNTNSQADTQSAAQSTGDQTGTYMSTSDGSADGATTGVYGNATTATTGSIEAISITGMSVDSTDTTQTKWISAEVMTPGLGSTSRDAVAAAKASPTSGRGWTPAAPISLAGANRDAGTGLQSNDVASRSSKNTARAVDQVVEASKSVLGTASNYADYSATVSKNSQNTASLGVMGRVAGVADTIVSAVDASRKTATTTEFMQQFGGDTAKGAISALAGALATARTGNRMIGVAVAAQTGVVVDFAGDVLTALNDRAAREFALFMRDFERNTVDLTHFR